MPISVENVEMILIQHRVTTDFDVPQKIMKKMGDKIDTDFYNTTQSNINTSFARSDNGLYKL